MEREWDKVFYAAQEIKSLEEDGLNSELHPEHSSYMKKYRDFRIQMVELENKFDYLDFDRTMEEFISSQKKLVSEIAEERTIIRDNSIQSVTNLGSALAMIFFIMAAIFAISDPFKPATKLKLR